MDLRNYPKATLILGFSILVYFLASYTLNAKQDSREPPRVRARIPFVGHVIGLVRKKFRYYVELRRRVSTPIFTIDIPGSKIYIVTSLDLVQAVQKYPKILAFPPIEAKFASSICGTSKDAHDKALQNVNGDDGDWGFSMDSYAAMRTALVPGAELDKMNQIMIESTLMLLGSLRPKQGRSTKIELARWLRDSVTLSTTNSVYGPANPFKNSAIVDAFWQFESQLMKILGGSLLSPLAHRGLSGRAKVSAAFEAYFRNKKYLVGSSLVQNRYEAGQRNGVSTEDIAKFEVGGAIALLVNTTPAVFWTLLHIYSDKNLLSDVREEIDAVTKVVTLRNGQSAHCIDVSSVRTSCSLLTSAFQETLRYRSMGTSVRQVMQDTMLDERWLLKGNAMVHMPNYIIHRDEALWGPDADVFNPRRFMKGGKSHATSTKRTNPAAFRAFGGGTTLCPGRHFATNEVLAFATIFLARYDLRPVNGNWYFPTFENTNVAAVIMEPDYDIVVEVSERRGYEEASWKFTLDNENSTFAVAAEDKM